MQDQEIEHPTESTCSMHKDVDSSSTPQLKVGSFTRGMAVLLASLVLSVFPSQTLFVLSNYRKSRAEKDK